MLADRHQRASKVIALTCQQPGENIWCFATWRPSHAEETQLLVGQSTNICHCHIPHPAAHNTPKYLRTIKLGKRAWVLKGMLQSKRRVEDTEDMGSKVEGESSRDLCTVWGIRGVALEKVLMDWRSGSPTHILTSDIPATDINRTEKDRPSGSFILNCPYKRYQKTFSAAQHHERLARQSRVSISLGFYSA